MGQGPAGGGFGVADDAEVGEGLELGDELVVRQGVERRRGEIRHGPEADGTVVSSGGDPASERVEVKGPYRILVTEQEVGLLASDGSHTHHAGGITGDDQVVLWAKGDGVDPGAVGLESCEISGFEVDVDGTSRRARFISALINAPQKKRSKNNCTSNAQ